MVRKNLKIKIGIILISISVIMFLILFSVPLVHMQTKLKITFSTVLIILGELCFWVGTLLIGKEVWNKYKTYIKSGEWLRKKQ